MSRESGSREDFPPGSFVVLRSSAPKHSKDNFPDGGSYEVVGYEEHDDEGGDVVQVIAKDGNTYPMSVRHLKRVSS